jgi:predicted DNA-binding transcriptional regulator AlpA
MAASTPSFDEFKLGIRTRTRRVYGKTSPRRRVREINTGIFPDYQEYLQSRDPIEQNDRERRHLGMFYHIVHMARRAAEKARLHAMPISADPRVGHHKRGHGEEGTRSSAASGDGNDGSDPERRLQTYGQAEFAVFLCISKKTLQNIYSRTPHLLPPAIHVPGARGPRWTQQAIQEWLNSRPKHTHKPFPSAPKRKAGRPRIALVSGKGGAK